MGNKWPEVKLEDVVTLLGDGLHGTPIYDKDGEYCFINGNNLENGRIVIRDKTKRIGYDQFIKHQKKLNDRTILVSINGTIGNVAYYNDEKVILGKSACYFNLKDDVEKGYVRYVLESHLFQSYLHQNATGTTILNVSLKDMRAFRFKLPPIHEQKSIARILGTLDDKIELNRQMNQTLEAMAQALFKSWFVDFDPVIDNALAAGNPIPEPLQKRAEARQALGDKRKPLPEAIQSQFPDRFVFNEEMGWLPEGWEVGPISHLADLNSESWTNRKHPNTVEYVDLANTKNGHISEMARYEFADAPSRARRVLKMDDSIIGTVRPGNRSFAFIQRDGLTASTGFAVMRPKEEYNRAFVYLALTRDEVIDRFAHLADGAAYPAIRPEVVANHEFAIPNREILQSFDEQVYVWLKSIRQHEANNEILVGIRDTLLPKLLSGELRVSDTEKMGSKS